MKLLNRQTYQFLGILAVLSMLAAGIFKIVCGDMQNPIAAMIFGSFYMWIPTISVLIVQKLNGEKLFSNGTVKLSKLNKWFLIALIGMPILNLSAMLISGLMPAQELSFHTAKLAETAAQQAAAGQPVLSPALLLIISVASGFIAGISVNMLFAFGEEFAWRGWLLHQFRGMSFAKICVIIGVIWGVWHAPIIAMGHNYPAHPIFGMFMMTIFCVLFTPLITYVRIKSGSVWAAAIMHGSLNATAGLSVIYIDGFNDLLSGTCGLAGMILLLILNIILFSKEGDFVFDE